MLTKFEKVRIIGQRADQISKGASPSVDYTGLTDALSIAEKEFNEHKIPFIVERSYPNKKIVKIKLSDMKY